MTWHFLLPESDRSSWDLPKLLPGQRRKQPGDPSEGEDAAAHGAVGLTRRPPRSTRHTGRKCPGTDSMCPGHEIDGGFSLLSTYLLFQFCRVIATIID